MKILQVLSALCVVAAAMAVPQQSALQQVSLAANRFSNNFYLEVARQNRDNLICSPLSADVVLAMAAYGSEKNTRQQFNQVLHLPQPQAVGLSGYRSLISALNNVKNVELKIANKVFVGKTYPIRQSYKEVTEKDFHSVSQQLDFGKSVQSAETINNWVAENTNNRIKDIVQSTDLNSATAMVLVNAIYFKGKWQVEFDKDATAPRTFHLNTAKSIKVPTMYKENDFKTGDVPKLNAKFIELPYKGDELKMIIILPNEIDGLPEVESKLDQVNLNTLLDNTYAQTVRLFLPKFKIESTIELNDVLQNMGLTNMFDSSNADFSGISEFPTYVSKVVQKAFIEVNEEGSEAAAATDMEFEFRMLAPSRPPKFSIDRPFVAIIHHNGIKIFEGHVINPKFSSKTSKRKHSPRIQTKITFPG